MPNVYENCPTFENDRFLLLTKVPVYAVERIEAMKRMGFEKSGKLLVGTIDGYAYKDYRVINR